MNMKNMSDFIYQALAATIKTTTTTASSISETTKQAATGVGSVTWSNEHLYDEVDVYFAAAYINDSWVTISNNISMNSVKNTRDDINNNHHNSQNSNYNNMSTLLSYGSISNQLSFMNITGVDKTTNNNNNSTNNTTTTNISEELTNDEMITLIQMLALSIVLGLMILITIIGNVFVIAAIMLERNLQNVANYLVASLAVADLFVACLVMPLGAVMEISQGWILGPELCDIWTCCDVLCCTASILHLVAIASDRYWTVTNIDYTNFRTPQRVFLMIACVWIASFLVSLAPQFGWKDPEYMERIKNQNCMVSQDVGYQIFETCSTFYVPLFVILVLYWKIYKIARKRIQRRTNRPHFNALQANNGNNQTKSRKQKNKEKQQLKQQLREIKQQQQLQQEQIKQQQQLQLQQEQLEEEQSEIVASEQTKQQQKAKRQKRLKICFGVGVGVPAIETIQISQQQQQQQQQIEDTTKNGVTICSISAAGAAIVGADGGVGINDKPLTALSTLTVGGGGVGGGTGEETEFSTSNFDSKSHGTEVTTISSDAEELQTPQSTSEINTISHQVVILPQHKQSALAAAAASGDVKSNTLTVPQMKVSGTQNINVASEPNSGDGDATIPTTTTASAAGTTGNKLLTSIPNPLQKLVKRRQLLEARRERKAAQTLAIITGAFVVCWLPFFVTALLLPLCKNCDINPTVASVFLWLGYFNSTLNPIIYTVFNPEFRRAFQRIVFGRQTLPHAVASRKM